MRVLVVEPEHRPEPTEIDSMKQADCPFNGDISNDCADCVYSFDFHLENGECVRRLGGEHHADISD